MLSERCCGSGDVVMFCVLYVLLCLLVFLLCRWAACLLSSTPELGLAVSYVAVW